MSYLIGVPLFAWGLWTLDTLTVWFMKETLGHAMSVSTSEPSEELETIGISLISGGAKN